MGLISEMTLLADGFRKQFSLTRKLTIADMVKLITPPPMQNLFVGNQEFVFSGGGCQPLSIKFTKPVQNYTGQATIICTGIHGTISGGEGQTEFSATIAGSDKSYMVNGNGTGFGNYFENTQGRSFKIEFKLTAAQNISKTTMITLSSSNSNLMYSPGFAITSVILKMGGVINALLNAVKPHFSIVGRCAA